jgi:glyoxylase-like metal-dependent hydrolase (beta-lactamase superfamily II)
VKSLILFLFTLIPAIPTLAEDLAPLPVIRVADNVYSAIGETGPPTYDNGGHNNNLSFIVTSEGVFVFNGGDNNRLARRLHLSILSLTDQPVVWVADENGQGHSFLGNDYWREQGVRLIAHRDAIAEIEAKGNQVLKRMQAIVLEKGEGTKVAVPEHTVDSIWSLNLGGTLIELRSFGAAHSPGDMSLWLPQQKILISGDIAFHQRLLAIFPETDVASWIESFELMATLGPEIIIPGHGQPTDIQSVRWATQEYLQYLTDEIEQILDNDGGLDDAYAIDQSAYAHLNTFDELAVKNAGRLFQTMELEAF